MSKFSKKKKDMPAINTASLPDIVFMLLFFFMVATTMRETDPLVKADIPNGTEVKKLKKKKLIRTIYVGQARDKKYGKGDKIQLNDKISSVKEIKNFIFNSIDGLDDKSDANAMTTLIKADKKASVGTISDIKRELRDINALKITYATKTGNVMDNVK